MWNELLAYTEGDDHFDAFIARPDTPPPWPAVLICHAWGGRGELEQARALALSELGYLGAAIDLYGVGRRGNGDRAASAALMGELTGNPPLLRRRLAAAFAAVRSLPEVDPDRMGMIGFCFGGLCALLGARMGLPLRGVVSFHGLLKLGEPLDAKVSARVLVLHGQDDPMVSTADIAAFAAEMQRLHVDWQLHAYPGVVHAFTNPSANDPSFGTVYDAEADRRSWQEMRAFFAELFARPEARSLADAENPSESDAGQLAALLNLGLAENEDTADGIAGLLGQPNAIGEIDDDDFDADAEVPDGVELEGEKGLAGSSGGDAASDIGSAIGSGSSGDTAGASPDDMLPPDADVVSDDDPNMLRSGPWTDLERRRARGLHATYRLHATHHRTQPISSQFTGECQAVRVRLPQRRPESGSYIGTYLGRVEVDDHLLFSVDEVADIYERQHARPPQLDRVELITGTRFMGRRFSPISCFLAYSADTYQPCFYVLEGGSAAGKPQSLYVAQDLHTQIHQQAGFRFTPLSCTSNWYTGRLELDEQAQHPQLLHMTSAQQADGEHQYFELHVRYALESTPRRVIAPFGLQIEAAVRVLAIAEQAGCELGTGRGGLLQPVVGPVAEAARRWDIRPQGSASAEQRERYCGCPKPR